MVPGQILEVFGGDFSYHSHLAGALSNPVKRENDVKAIQHLLHRATLLPTGKLFYEENHFAQTAWSCFDVTFSRGGECPTFTGGHCCCHCGRRLTVTVGSKKSFAG
jgi:hypothetical protein